MAVLFFDSSGLVKRYVNETGTAWVSALADPMAGNQIYLAAITAVEIASAVSRQLRGGSLTPASAATAMGEFRQDYQNQYQVVEITPDLIAAAMTLAETHVLRAYDAVQVAAAIEVHAQCIALGLTMTLISADASLNAAAVAEGLAVDDPNAHP